MNLETRSPAKPKLGKHKFSKVFLPVPQKRPSAQSLSGPQPPSTPLSKVVCSKATFNYDYWGYSTLDKLMFSPSLAGIKHLSYCTCHCVRRKSLPRSYCSVIIMKRSLSSRRPDRDTNNNENNFWSPPPPMLLIEQEVYTFTVPFLTFIWVTTD